MSIINREPKAGKARATIEPVEAVEAIGIWKPQERALEDPKDSLEKYSKDSEEYSSLK